MRALFASFVIACSALATAHAADLPLKANPPPPVPSWAGFYAGLNVGYGWAAADPKLTSAVNFNPGAIPLQIPFEIALSRKGVIGGGQFGYNWQSGNIVAGLEADIQGSAVHGSGSYFYTGFLGGLPISNTVDSSIDWFGTVRGRLGVTLQPSFLLYATGGLAYGGVSFNANVIAVPATVTTFQGSTSGIRTGWTAGAGAEWAIAPRWTVRAEYLHVDLGSTSVLELDPKFPTSSLTYRLSHDMNIVRGGINYRF